MSTVSVLQTIEPTVPSVHSTGRRDGIELGIDAVPSTISWGPINLEALNLTLPLAPLRLGVERNRDCEMGPAG